MRGREVEGVASHRRCPHGSCGLHVASSVLPGVVGVGGVLPGVPVVAVGGLVAVVAKASVVVTFFFSVLARNLSFCCELFFFFS